MIVTEYREKVCDILLPRGTVYQCPHTTCEKVKLTFLLACLHAEHAVDVFLPCREESDEM